MKRIISNQPFPIGLLGNHCDTNNTQSVPYELLEYENIQNKPNYKATAHMPNGPWVTGHESRFIQNEPNYTHKKYAIRHTQYDIREKNKPNFTPNAQTKHTNAANITQISHSLLQLCTRQLRTFAQKTQKIRNFCKYLKTTHLTPYISKTYINISHQNTHLLINPFTHLLRNLSAKVADPLRWGGPIYPNYAKQTQFKSESDERRVTFNMQNKPNFNRQATQYEKMQNEPNFQTNGSKYSINKGLQQCSHSKTLFFCINLYICCD